MSNTTPLFETFFILCGVGALAALLAPARWSPIVLAAFGSLAALLVLGMSSAVLVGNASFRAELWSILSLGTLVLEVDRLSAFFLFVSGLVFLPVSLFSGVYLAKYVAHFDLRYFGVLYHALFASIVLVLIAGDAISFLIGWEAMSITSYLLVTYEYEREESAQGGFVMLAMSEAGAIAVAIAFLLVAGVGGHLDFAGLRQYWPTLGENVKWAVLLLSFFGFAVKAGLVPVNSWLPLAHPVAPTNISALLSTVIVNLD
jgi:hydrogenase-4 component B